jgi:hypothetical protein
LHYISSTNRITKRQNISGYFRFQNRQTKNSWLSLSEFPRLVIFPRRIILRAGAREAELLAAVRVFGAHHVEPLAGIVSAEFQRGLCAEVLRGRVFQRSHGMVAAARDAGAHGYRPFESANISVHQRFKFLASLHALA